MYKIAICDDDKNYRESVKDIIKFSPFLKEDDIIFFEYPTGEELLKQSAILHDLIFVDIRMPGIDGNKTAELIRGVNENALIVYCSSYFEPTPEGINIGQPYRYIIKDVGYKSLKKEMKNIICELKRRNEEYLLTVTKTGKTLRIPINTILYISLKKRGSCLYLEREADVKELRCHEPIKDLYGQLKDKGFEYAHNSYIVNLEKIVDIDRTAVRLKGNIQLNIARSKKVRFETKMMDFLCGGKNI